MLSPDYKGGDCDDQGCPDQYAPVCGSDGVTYSNECNLSIEKCNHPEKNLTMVLDGECPTQRKLMFSEGYQGGDCEDQGCPDDYAPVCGSDGVTYSNECNLGLEKCNHPEKKLTKSLDGECPTM
ncbi:Kazal-like serine protease inhibitor [Phytophthora megakarya]|uniref:Kazal-like serine protease inhibitor n=1 Tax=Phytophthora megakarya TaxID=4795 RepID=A0A225US26_9STRA|nr:Kazal-like serine protease inhibitor [Phytophthora megakarya]